MSATGKERKPRLPHTRTVSSVSTPAKPSAWPPPAAGDTWQWAGEVRWRVRGLSALAPTAKTRACAGPGRARAMSSLCRISSSSSFFILSSIAPPRLSSWRATRQGRGASRVSAQRHTDATSTAHGSHTLFTASSSVAGGGESLALPNRRRISVQCRSSHKAVCDPHARDSQLRQAGPVVAWRG